MWSDDDDTDRKLIARHNEYDIALRNASELQAAIESQAQHPPRCRNKHTTLTERSREPIVDWMKDWIDERVWRFFSDIEGFHLGSLDPAGRNPSRYEKLKRKWDAYLQDFDSLAPFVAMTKVDQPHFDTTTREWVDEVYSAGVVSNTDLWDAFCAKWKLEFLVSYEDLAALTGHTRAVLAAHPCPQFQKASLQDLPSDIIHLIYVQLAETPKDAHSFASVSKSIRYIGHDYIFKTRNVVIGKDNGYYPIFATSLGEADAEVRVHMTVARDKFLKHVEFLVSRPDICGMIQRLRVANNWGNLDFVATDRICLVHLEDGEMFDPVKRALDDLLARVSVARLDLEYLPLDMNLVRRICAQDHLVEAHFMDCMLPWEIEQALLSNLPPPICSSIRYLSLTDIPFAPTSMWSLLTVCPQLRSLQAIAGSADDGFQIPASGALRLLRPQLCSLQMLELHGLSRDEVALLTGWIDAAALRLDHLRLIFNSKVADDAATLLLRALHRGGAPLRTFMLDGLELNDGSALVDLIAGLFPQLEGLALGYRSEPYQCQSWPCAWPLLPSAYAARLSAFARLRCFGANFDLEGNQAGSAPSGIQNESQGADGEMELDYKSDEDEDEDRYARQYLALIAPFAAACPSLVYLVLSNSDARPQDCFRISRGQDGKVDVEPALESAEDIPEVARLYNPPRVLRLD
ncbi:hypothetical protein AURDEDRAFT_168789 [Auricularia subglabra TFB-10046 SS5]|nr:hypothetical protein AURDEDRAFT_168789 [Auricularia subglabra TFB-10046 SS5]